MVWLWTWGGECFGYRRGDKLFTYLGRQIGCFHDEEVFGGSYACYANYAGYAMYAGYENFPSPDQFE